MPCPAKILGDRQPVCPNRPLAMVFLRSGTIYRARQTFLARFRNPAQKHRPSRRAHGSRLAMPHRARHAVPLQNHVTLGPVAHRSPCTIFLYTNKHLTRALHARRNSIVILVVCPRSSH